MSDIVLEEMPQEETAANLESQGALEEEFLDEEDTGEEDAFQN